MIRISHKKDQVGFTLIELMIVIAIIGILAAIAIPQFSVYKAKSYNAESRADLKNAYTAAQAYFTDNESAVFDDTALSTSGFHTTPGVVLTITDGTQTGLTLTATNSYAGSLATTYTMNAGGVISP